MPAINIPQLRMLNSFYTLQITFRLSVFCAKDETDFMKNTPFTSKHIALGAKMAEFAGYNMPISYSGINDEHHAVRTNAGIFDVSHMGEFILKGEHALELIQ